MTGGSLFHIKKVLEGVEAPLIVAAAAKQPMGCVRGHGDMDLAGIAASRADTFLELPLPLTTIQLQFQTDAHGFLPAMEVRFPPSVSPAAFFLRARWIRAARCSAGGIFRIA